MAIDPKKWTIKTQEAVAAAIDQARALSNPELTPDHLLTIQQQAEHIYVDRRVTAYAATLVTATRTPAAHGLEVLATLPETPTRAQQELDLQIALGPAFVVTRGSASPAVEQVYARAQELCQQVGETPQLFPVLWGLWRRYNNRCEYQRARALGEELLGLAEQLQDPLLSLEAHRALGNTLSFYGELGLAYTHAQHGLALYDPQQMRAHALRYGQDSGVACRTLGATTLWLLGYPDQAR